MLPSTHRFVMIGLLRLLPVVVALLCLSSTSSPVSAQSYVPQVFPLTSCSSSTSSLVTLGDITVDGASTPNSVYSGEVYLTTFNNSLFGSILTQMSLQLADHSSSGGPIHLRMGVYSVGAASASSTSMTLVGQTDEITVYPSGAGTLYANLLQPVQLLNGGQYALGVWSDSSLKTFYSYSSLSGFYGSNIFYLYIDYGMPSTLPSAYGPSSRYSVAIAATGCSESSLSPSGTSLYYLCGTVEQYTPATSNTDYTSVSVTTATVITGVLAVSSSATTTAFGSGYSIQSVSSGSISTVLSGQESYSYPYFSTNAVSISAAAANTTNKVKSTTPSNLLYTSGAARVDTNGVLFVGSNGAQYVLQWNSDTNQYQFVSSAAPASSTASPVVYSTVTLTPVSAANHAVLTCLSPQSYTVPPVPTCPAGTSAVNAGDVTADLSYLGYSNTYSYGNVLYFRPFIVSVAGTIVQSLSTYLLPNPNTIVHLRLGLYALNGSLQAPSWTLLSQTAEQVIANAANTLVTAPLPSAVTLQPGTYSIGIWFDQPVYTYSTYWDVAPQPYNLYQSYTSLSATGQMPSFATPASDYQLTAAGAQICVPGSTALVQFSFCAAFATQDGDTDTTSGVLTALASTYTNSFGTYYLVTAGNATRSSVYGSFLSIGATSNPSANRLYVPSTTAGSSALDSQGLQFVFELYSSDPSTLVLSAQRIPNTPAYQYSAVSQLYYSAPVRVSVGPGEFSYQLYTGGVVPDCQYTPATYANILTPASQAVTACPTAGQLFVVGGDSVFSDYSNQAEGNAVSALTVYTNSFTIGSGGVTISQVAVDLLANTAQTLNAYLGVYSSAGTLLGSTAVLNWQQVYDQQVVASLITPLQLAAGTYYAALVSDGPINIATSTSVRSPSATVTSVTGGLPATLSTTGSTAASVPIVVYGCAQATHSLCASVQYYTPASLGGPTSTTYQYQGLLSGTSNADGSITVQLADLHVSALQRVSTGTVTATTAFSELFLAGSSKIYPAGAQALDATGLLMNSPALNLSISLSYSAALGQYVDSWGSSTYPGSQVVTSSAVLAPVGNSGTAVPSCSIVYLPSSLSAAPAAPICASGSSAVVVGDDVGTDYSSNAEEIYYNSNNFLITSSVKTGSSAVLLSQVAIGINNNFNTVAKFRFAVYSATFSLLSSSNEVTAVNPVDEVVVGVLSTPVTLLPNTTYLLALWVDDSLYMSFATPYGNKCGPLAYSSSTAFPSIIPNSDYSCATIALAGLGCTTDTPPTSFDSSSSSGSSDVNLSKGAVAGIVIGCVVGTNLLLLACMFLLCGLSRGGKSDGSSSRFNKNAERQMDPSSRVELATTEPSRVDQ